MSDRRAKMTEILLDAVHRINEGEDFKVHEEIVKECSFDLNRCEENVRIRRTMITIEEVLEDE